jgi:hypothetical protein
MPRSENLRAAASTWMKSLLEAGLSQEAIEAERADLARALSAEGEAQMAAALLEATADEPSPCIRDAGDRAILLRLDELEAANKRADAPRPPIGQD